MRYARVHAPQSRPWSIFAHFQPSVHPRTHMLVDGPRASASTGLRRVHSILYRDTSDYANGPITFVSCKCKRAPALHHRRRGVGGAEVASAARRRLGARCSIAVLRAEHAPQNLQVRKNRQCAIQHTASHATARNDRNNGER